MNFYDTNGSAIDVGICFFIKGRHATIESMQMKTFINSISF